MAIHNADEELRLRHIEVRLTSFALHEGGGLLPIPGALSFVKHDYFLDRDIVIADVLISKVMDVLNKAAHLALRCLLGDSFALYFVASKGLSEHVNEWPVTGKKDGMFITMFVRASCRDIQPSQSFTRTRHASDKADGFRAFLAGSINHHAHAGAQFVEVLLHSHPIARCRRHCEFGKAFVPPQ